MNSVSKKFHHDVTLVISFILIKKKTQIQDSCFKFSTEREGERVVYVG